MCVGGRVCVCSMCVWSVGGCVGVCRMCVEWGGGCVCVQDVCGVGGDVMNTWQG